MAEEKPKRGLDSLARTLLGARQQSDNLLQLYQPYVIDNRVYKRVRINLDGYTFRNCAFIDCLLQTAKGNFILESCHLHMCTFQFSGNALRVAKLCSLLLGNWEQLNEGLRAQIEADGSCTVR